MNDTLTRIMTGTLFLAPTLVFLAFGLTDSTHHVHPDDYPGLPGLAIPIGIVLMVLMVLSIKTYTMAKRLKLLAVLTFGYVLQCIGIVVVSLMLNGLRGMQ